MPEKKLSNGHEYILIYAKNAQSDIFNLLDIEGKDAEKFKNPGNDPRGPWVSSDFAAQGWRPNQMYEITTPSGMKMRPQREDAGGILKVYIMYCFLKDDCGLVPMDVESTAKNLLEGKRRKRYLDVVDKLRSWAYARRNTRACFHFRKGSF
jgi:hypothetical protein